MLGGWVLPDARISYTGESGSEIVETFPEGRVFHAPLPEGVQAVCTFYFCTLLIFFLSFLLTFLFQVPARTANAMVGVINRLKSALVRARSALSCRSPHSTRVMCPLFSFDLYLLFGFRLFTLFFVLFCRRLLDVPGPTTWVPRAGDTVVRERGHGTRPYGIAVLTWG